MYNYNHKEKCELTLNREKYRPEYNFCITSVAPDNVSDTVCVGIKIW